MFTLIIEFLIFHKQQNYLKISLSFTDNLIRFCSSKFKSFVSKCFLMEFSYRMISENSISDVTLKTFVPLKNFDNMKTLTLFTQLDYLLHTKSFTEHLPQVSITYSNANKISPAQNHIHTGSRMLIIKYKSQNYKEPNCN